VATGHTARLRRPDGRRQSFFLEVVVIMSSLNSQTAPARTGWTGWVAFAAAILILAGIFSVVQGLMAVIGPNTYFAAVEGELFLLDVAGWGWWNIVLGLLLIGVGGALSAGATWARVIAVILVMVSAVSQLLLIPVQPWWSLIVIAIDILVLFAIIAHGRELKYDD
jgi:hypothetical protein